ncbi:MAG: hypothetical protein JSS30_03125 [Verrucomicrobia bacterium]|nr:hypothetical protein [Verrucomicrobiota bacterium]
MFVATAVITMIACHGASADHFAVFAKQLSDEGRQVRIYASEHAVKKFQDRQIPIQMVFNTEEDLAEEIAENCAGTLVLTDVGHPFAIDLHKALGGAIAYYDNPEPFVPGGYSKVAEEVMKLARKVIFANSNLEASPLIDLPLEKRVGLGYYPTAAAEKVVKRRIEEREKMRRQFGYADKKILVYFGGNNEEYFKEAFPAFLEFLEQDLPGYIFVLQPHPAAKDKQLMSPKLILSNWSSEDIQVIADGALYYQTSMGPQFALAGIPMLQVGHKTYEDVMVRSGLCPSVTNGADFAEKITQMKPIEIGAEQRQAIYKSLGIRHDWFERLKVELSLN